MELKETFVSRQEIFHGRIVDLRVDTVRLPNGHLTTREVIDHPGGVAVVAIDENDNVLTVKQYRYVFSRVLEEIPAGKLERGEDPREAAIRELKEETGAEPETFLPLGKLLIGELAEGVLAWDDAKLSAVIEFAVNGRHIIHCYYSAAHIVLNRSGIVAHVQKQDAGSFGVEFFVSLCLSVQAVIFVQFIFLRINSKFFVLRYYNHICIPPIVIGSS